ncbi:hypothetical protein GCM10020331_055060 [Ectobacillus funiculus]
MTSLLTFTACSNGQEAAPKQEEQPKQEAAGTVNPQDFFYKVITSGKKLNIFMGLDIRVIYPELRLLHITA